MREQFTVVALPYSCDPNETFHVSFFVSPDIAVDDPRDTLAVTELFQHWTKALADATFTLEDQAGEIDCEPLRYAVEDGLWEEVFPAETPVNSYTPPDWTQRPWRTFHPGTTTGIAKTVNLLATMVNGVEAPTVQQLPWFGTQILETLGGGDVGRQRFNPLDLVGRLESGQTEALDAATRERVPLAEFRSHREYFSNGTVPDNFMGGTPMANALLELHRARRFYSHPEEETDYRDRPEPDNPGPAEPDKQIPDFHARVSLVNDHGPLQRKLALVIDVKADTNRLAGSEWLCGRILIPGREDALKVVRVATRRVGRALVTRAEDESQWINGRLPVGNADSYDLLDLDPDGAALKTEQYLSSYLRTAAAALQGAPANAAPPALRTTGFTVARKNNGAATADAIDKQTSVLDTVRTQPPNQPAVDAPLMTTEDVMQGVRVEVHDDKTDRWRSLHQVRVSADVVGGRSFSFDDEAFLQESAPTHAGQDTSPIHVHEAVFGWDGWSLSAARPALPVVNEGGVERVVTDPQPPADPSTPVLIDRTAAPGTLPRLRFGRRYSFRVWGVDLACNSRPHRLEPPPAIAAADQPPAEPVTRVAADLSQLGDFRTGALSRLRDSAAASAEPAAQPIDTGTDGAGLQLAQALPEIVGRLQVKRGESVQQPVASALADVRSVLASGLADDALAPAATAVLNPAVIRGGLALDPDDLAGPVGTSEAVAVSAELPFVRYQPVPPPAVVPRRLFTEGESNEVLVVRSRVSQDPATLAVLTGTPVEYAAANAGRFATCERHLVPPKTSQLEAEEHGAFDAAIASPDAAARNLWLHAAIRESGTLFDLDVPRLDDPSVRDPQDGVALVHGPGASPAELRTLPLPPGEAPGPGQYVVHDTDLVHTPYLPDVIARGLGFVFPDAGKEWTIVPPFGVEGFTARYPGALATPDAASAWPSIDGYRLVLNGAEELNAVVAPHLVTISLPRGTALRSRLSSTLTLDDLAVMGAWLQLPEAMRQLPGVAEAAANGWLWALTPPTALTMVHAVPRPIVAPEPIGFRIYRAQNATNAMLLGGVELHGPSTDSLLVDARWDEVLDDLSDPQWKVMPDQRQVAATTAIEPWEDIAILAGMHADQTYNDAVVGHVRSHRAVHEFGDTKHRLVKYRFRATTRFREYFAPDELAPATPSDDPSLPIDDGRSTVSAEVAMHVPNTSLPAPPMVHSVIPLFRWEDETEPDQPMARRRTRRSGVRVYLERPWFVTGADEQIGVVLALGQRPDSTFTSQWGGDPFWAGSNVADREAVQVTDLLSALGLDDYDSVAGPSGKPEIYPSPDDPNVKVMVVPYRPQYNLERRKWFVDIGFPARFWPFVQLSLVRYQPYSVDGRHISKPVRCDFVQVVPERTASVSRTSEGTVRVLVSGPAGYHDASTALTGPRTFGGVAGGFNAAANVLAGVAAVAANRVLRARLQTRDAGATSDLAWQTVTQTDLVVRGFAGTLANLVWTGELDVPEGLPFARPTTPGTHRVRIEEWETFVGDPANLGDPNSPPTTEIRLIYADEFELGSPE
ncbi:hypothetical protein [Micropruina sonneratiae]|uniref:hypothetical protein n=1 Tax=Micropruina sonneratiae TaxID=2986940 RepID=UPI0022260537|nr:hypothetical protein [Micropruina sp. KQZ13P-5]MCW3158830.1 hypothetical protein [Micropruina sp. KQZ13P-5]